MKVLSTATLAYCPLHLLELVALADLPNEVSYEQQYLREIVHMSNSFLIIRDNIVYFIHQSAKEFLLEKSFDNVFDSGTEDVHYSIFSRSLNVMFRTL